MEIDLENMIMSEEQAHLFAVNAVFTLGGAIIIRDNLYQYNLCNYTKIV